jgi:D-threo-aldose 1-dehydrogenase
MAEQNQPLMPKVTLGRSGIISTKLGLGTASWPLHISYTDTITMLQTAFDAGVRHIDTAPLYQTEHIIGQALQDMDLPEDLVLATKAGSYSEPSLGVKGQDYHADTIYRSVERSLERLGVDYIHILHIHDAKQEHIAQIFAPDGALAALQDLKNQGVIGAIGMGTIVLSCLQTAAESGAFDILQIFHTYTLLNQSAEEKLFPTCRQAGISILNSAPFAGYILATGAVPDARYNYIPAQPDVIEATRRLEEVCARKGIDIATAAMAHSYRHRDIDVTVVASGKPQRVKQWVDAMSVPLTDADVTELLSAAGGQYTLPLG